MKASKTWMAILTALVLLLALSCAFAVPSGAILTTAEQRYQDEAPLDWGEDSDAPAGADLGASALPLTHVTVDDFRKLVRK